MMSDRVRLSHVALEACLRGACGIEAAPDDSVLPRRCSARQLALFADDPRRQTRGRCPAGCHLDLIVEAAALELDLHIGERVRNTVAVDACHAGGRLLRAAVGLDSNQLHLRLVLDEAGPQRIRLWLSQYAELRIDRLELFGVRNWRPAPRPLQRMLVLGDSISQGMDCPGPSATWPSLVSQRLGLECLNQGIGGHRFSAAYVDAQAIRDPLLVTVAYGTNDWAAGATATATHASASAMLNQIRCAWPAARVLVIGPIVRFAQPARPPAATLAEIDAAIGAAATTTACDFLPGGAVLPRDPALLVDGVHPGERGAQLYAEAVLRHLDQEPIP